MILKWILTLSLIFTSIVAFSQYEDFIYWKELCDCKAKFDSTKYSKAQLQNTFDYLWWAPIIDSDATVWTLDKIEELSVDDLQAECDERIKKLQTFKFVDDAFWTRLIKERIEYYENTCQLREFTILAYSNPDILLHYNLVDSTCVYYRDAVIAGGQDMIKAWIKLNEIQKSQNADPDKVQQKFDEKYYSSQRLEWARLIVMQFGWWNNANHILPHVSTDYNYAEEFERLFINVDCECDEP